LPFGGFLAFEPEFIHCYKKKIRNKLVSRKLTRKPIKVSAITPIDEFDPSNKKTKEGFMLMRYLLATECGELYMLAFDLKNIHLISSPAPSQGFDVSVFI
jgi:hypothetical protein